MLKRANLLWLIAGVVALGLVGAQDDTSTLAGKPAPRVRLKDLSGQWYDSKNESAKVSVYEFWGVNCGYCMVALPKLQKVADWVKKEKLSVAIHTINTGDDLADVKAVLKRLKVTVPSLLDSNYQASEDYKVIYIPVTVLVKDGKIAKVHVGLPENGEYDDVLKSEIQELLKQK